MYQKKIKENNEKKIFHYIYKEDRDLCIAEIGSALDMSFPTVKNVLYKLIDRGIIKESLKISSGNGRKAQAYCLNKNFCYSIGVRIHTKKFRFLLVNERGSVSKELSVVENFTEDNLITRLEEELENFLESISPAVRSKVLGVGIAIPGVVDKIGNTLEIAPDFKVEESKIEKLSEKFNLKILVDNESNLSAIAEKFLGRGEAFSDFITLDLSETISMANFREESSYGSFSFRASRVEHMCIDIDGRLCQCGHRGCWGTYVSDKALLKSFKGEYPEIKKYSDIFKREHLDDERGQELLDDYIRYLAVGIKNLIFLYNPEKIIITGNICRHRDIITDQLLDYIYKDHIFFRGRETIIFSDLRENSGTLGASIMPIVDSLF